MAFEKIRFTNKNGHELAARLDLPIDGQPVAYSLFAHCFTCTKNLNAVAHISRALTRERIAVLRFDFTGLGESDGNFSDTNFSTNVSDLVAAALFLEKEYEGPKILIGHSLGGSAILQAASRIPSSKALVTIGSPADPNHVKRHLGDSMHDIQERGEAEITLEGRPFTIKKQFLDDLDEVRMEETLRNLGRALLILHSPLDSIVGIENAAKIFKMAKHPKSFVSLDTADHLLSQRNDSMYVGSLIAHWARKYIQSDENDAKSRTSHSGKLVIQTGERGFTTEIMTDGHSFIADESYESGGHDSGPNPYDYLLAALGSCTTITLRMYADRKKWPLEKCTVTINYKKDHAQACRECDQDGEFRETFEIQVELKGDLTDEQRQRLLEIASKCPVHRTLNNPVNITLSLK